MTSSSCPSVSVSPLMSRVFPESFPNKQYQLLFTQGSGESKEGETQCLGWKIPQVSGNRNSTHSTVELEAEVVCMMFNLISSASLVAPQTALCSPPNPHSWTDFLTCLERVEAEPPSLCRNRQLWVRHQEPGVSAHQQRGGSLVPAQEGQSHPRTSLTEPESSCRSTANLTYCFVVWHHSTG